MNTANSENETELAFESTEKIQVVSSMPTDAFNSEQNSDSFMMIDPNRIAMIAPYLNSYYMLVPLAMLVFIVFLSAMVYILAKDHNRIYKRNYVPNFTFDDVDCDIDDPTECLLAGKLQIDNKYEYYQSARIYSNNNDVPEHA